MIIPKFLQSIGYTGLVIILAMVVVVQFHLLVGAQPTNLGVKNGQLAACPASPNCVNSQASTSDIAHRIAPLPLVGEPSAALAQLKQTIESMPRTNIVQEADNYLYVEFSSKLMGFVDDVEFYLDDRAKAIQVRSASRLGESDLGANRLRIEEIRSKLVA